MSGKNVRRQFTIGGVRYEVRAHITGPDAALHQITLSVAVLDPDGEPLRLVPLQGTPTAPLEMPHKGEKL